MRIRLPANSRLLPWLTELRNQWIALREFEHTPLVEIQGWSGVPGGQPLFESIFNFQDPSWDTALRAQGGKWAKREFGICSQSNYPLVVDAYGGNSVLIKILYHRTRFDDESITRMLGHVKTILETRARIFRRTNASNNFSRSKPGGHRTPSRLRMKNSSSRIAS